MHPRDLHGVMGHTERYHSPYLRRSMRGFGDDPGVVQGAITGIAEAAQKAACDASGGTWDTNKKVCLTKTGGQPTDPSQLMCQNVGGVWDTVKKTCLPPGSTPTPPPDTGPSMTTWILVGIAGVGLIWWMGNR